MNILPFGVRLRVFFLTPRTSVITVTSLGLGSRNDSRLRTRTPDSEPAQNQLTQKLSTDWAHGSFYPCHPTLLSSVREKNVTWSVCDGTGCSGTCRFIWLPFFIRGTSRYFRRSSYLRFVLITSLMGLLAGR